MSERQWGEPFTIEIHAAAPVVRCGYAMLAASTLALCLAIVLRWQASMLGPVGIVICCAGFAALTAGMMGMRRYAALEHRLVVDAGGEIFLNGAQVRVDSRTWFSGRLVGLVLRGGGGLMTVLLAPGCGDELELRHLRTYLRWTLGRTDAPVVHTGEQSAHAQADPG